MEPLESQTITVSPDLWTERYRQVTYLGITLCFTDKEFQFSTYDLCCCPFIEDDKTAENIIVVSSLSLLEHYSFLRLGY